MEITAAEHPRLFDFLGHVCQDVGVAGPTHVYVDYAVNAYVLADAAALWQLLVRRDKSLVIGLGLVNSVNLTEFKALLAHEFAHFAQQGMLIGPFTHKLRQLLYLLVPGAGARCEANAWRATSRPGLRQVFLWPARLVVGALTQAIAFCEQGLSRQMEFDADLMAVRLTGSDAPIHLLYRAQFGGVFFRQAVDDLKTAMQVHLVTSDLFYHQDAAGRFMRAQNHDPAFGQPPEPSAAAEVFSADGGDAEEATHPSCHARERNAKAHYLRSHFDTRSAWLLFANAAELRAQVTQQFYRWHFKTPHDLPRADPAAVQAFIDAEHADRSYDPKYHGLYDNRSLFLKDIAALVRRCGENPCTPAELAQFHATLYDAEVKEHTERYYRHLQKSQFLSALCNGWQRPANADFEFRGAIYAAEHASQILRKVERELYRDKQWLARKDRQVFAVYFQIAWQTDRLLAKELFQRYEFHVRLQKIWFDLQKLNPPLRVAIEFLNRRHFGSVPAHDFGELLKVLREVHAKMRAILHGADALRLPALRNLPAGAPLRPFLLDKNLLAGLSESTQEVRERWLIRLLDQFNEMKAKVGRLHFKSLAGILALQKQIDCRLRFSVRSALPDR